MQNVLHENHLIFMQMTSTEGICFHTNSLHKDSFCHIGKSKLGIGLFIHELLREPLIISVLTKRIQAFYPKTFQYLPSYFELFLVGLYPGHSN